MSDSKRGKGTNILLGQLFSKKKSGMKEKDNWA